MIARVKPIPRHVRCTPVSDRRMGCNTDLRFQLLARVDNSIVRKLKIAQFDGDTQFGKDVDTVNAQRR